MGLKDFLKQQGFITDSPADVSKTNSSADKKSYTAPEPVYFPVKETNSNAAAEPSFVAPLANNRSNAGESGQPDPAFIKFFEDEMAKSNLAGPDYFEFRQLLARMQEKMAAKGVASTDVVLQAVMTSFEAQNVTKAQIIEAAKHYKEVLQQKNDDFLRGAASEKNNQLQKRQAVLKQHEDAIADMQAQIAELETRRKKLEEDISREKTQLDVDKSLGQEGITKIERAEAQIAKAHAFMQGAIDSDIQRIQHL